MTEIENIVDIIRMECPNLHKETGLCFQYGYVCPFYETLMEHKAPNCDTWKGIKLREDDTYIGAIPEWFDMNQDGRAR
jgi:hypothetical protein